MRRLITFLAIMCPLVLAAQNTDYFKKSAAVNNGRLPNGVAYYLVQNDYDKSFADFALVQRGNDSREIAHSSLDSLPHFGSIKPYEYLASKGIGYTISGLASYSYAGSAYRFQSVPMYDEAASDSLLLMLFDLMDTYPGEQAVIVSGDINSSKVLERMKLFSMLVTPREDVDDSEVFKWEPFDSIAFECSHINSDRTAYIEATFCSSRIPSKEMLSTQPWIVKMFARQMAETVKKRILSAFASEGLALGGISFSYKGSKQAVKQERYSVRVCVDRGELVRATEILGAVAASFETSNLSRGEFSLVKGGFLSRVVLPLDSSIGSNPSYVNRCIADYLFGAGLYEPGNENMFYSSQRLEPSLERQLMNRFAASLFDRSKNLILNYSSPDYLFNRDSLVSRFYAGWDRETANHGNWNFRVDSSRLNSPSGKAKLKSTVPDALSGGKIWTFDNGISVLFKKTAAKGHFSYAFMFKGGANSIQGLQPGEKPYIEELFKLYDVSGMRGDEFEALMKSKGINFEPRITVSDLRFTGTVPTSSLGMLFQGMYSIASSRNFNGNAYNYYKSCQNLRQENENRGESGIRALLHNSTSPEYVYSSYRNPVILNNSTVVKADKFYSDKFNSWGSCLIVLVGDLDEYETQKYLSTVLGAFKSKQHKSSRKMEERLLSQRSTFIVGSAERPEAGDGTPSVNVSLTSEVPFSLQKYAALKIAVRALRRQLATEIAPYGAYVDVKESFDLLPSEIMNITVICRRCTGAGLPAGVGPSDSDYVLTGVRRAIEKLASENIPAASLKAYKASLSGKMKRDASRDESVVDAVLVRYSMGKNIFSGQEAAVNAVTADEVKALMKSLKEGTIVEYIVR